MIAVMTGRNDKMNELVDTMVLEEESDELSFPSGANSPSPIVLDPNEYGVGLIFPDIVSNQDWK